MKDKLIGLGKRKWILYELELSLEDIRILDPGAK